MRSLSLSLCLSLSLSLQSSIPIFLEAFPFSSKFQFPKLSQMAAFSYYQHDPCLLDPVFHLPNTPIKIPGFSGEPNNTTTTITNSYFSQFCPPQSQSQFQSQSQSLHQIPVDLSAHESSCLENVTKVYLSSNNEPSPSVTNINKHSTDSSSVVDKPESTVDQVTQKVSTAMDNKRKRKRNYSPHSKHAREVKGKKQNKCNSVKKDDDEEKRPKADDIKKAALEEAPKGGYIHVRARRGQATDSHSLAERVLFRMNYMQQRRRKKNYQRKCVYNEI